MKAIYAAAIMLLISISPAFSKDRPSSNDIIVRMKTELDLQQEQVTNITPIIEKYSIAFADLQKSIDDGSINPSAIDSQRQGLEAEETNELSQYLKPYQLSQWRQMQSQMDQPKDQDDSNADTDQDQYTNLPGRSP